jgi:hypothetical protein
LVLVRSECLFLGDGGWGAPSFHSFLSPLSIPLSFPGGQSQGTSRVFLLSPK